MTLIKTTYTRSEVHRTKCANCAEGCDKCKNGFLFETKEQDVTPEVVRALKYFQNNTEVLN